MDVNVTGELRSTEKLLGTTQLFSLPQLALGFQSDTWPLVNTGGYR